MKIKKALITAAGRNQRTLPLQTLVDRDGVAKTVLAIIIEEALSAGIEQVGVVVQPGDQREFAAAAGAHAGRLEFLEQTEPLGYGHAVWCARGFTGTSPFLLLVGDHVYVSSGGAGGAAQLVETASAADCSVSAVQATHESKLPYFGAVGGRRVAQHPGLYEVTEVLEKPTPTEAEQRLLVPGLRAGHYLCFFGMHVLTPLVMDLLGELVKEAGARGGVHLSTALARLARRERYLAFQAAGRRYDVGWRYGLLMAQLALGLAGDEREDVMAAMIEVLAQRKA
jgi:UTP--glucose-1-phosphate uridylyltransferase